MKLSKSKFTHISCESQPQASVVTTDLTEDQIKVTIEDILKVLLDISTIDFNKSFADMGMTPDQYNTLIERVNTAFGVTIDNNTNITSPNELLKTIVGMITQPLIATEVWDNTVFEGYIKEANELQAMLDLMTNTSAEGLGTSLVKALASAGDIFVRMGNSFKTSITRINHAVKRSEIKMYYESNMLKVSQVEKASYDLFKNLDMDKPVGMTGTFLNAVKAVNSAYTALDIYSFASAVERHLKDVRLLVARDSKSFSQLNTILQVIKTREKLMEDEKQTISKIFTSNETDSSDEFNKLYNDMVEFKEVRELLIGMMNRIDESTRLDGCVEECDTALHDIIALVEQDNQIDKTVISNLLEIIKYMSDACSFYGENVSRQLALEHNHVCNIAQCWQAIR